MLVWKVINTYGKCKWFLHLLIVIAREALPHGNEMGAGPPWWGDGSKTPPRLQIFRRQTHFSPGHPLSTETPGWVRKQIEVLFKATFLIRE